MTREPISIDPAGWTGASGPEWPKPADHARPDPLRTRESLIKALAGGCFGLLFAALSLMSIQPPRDPGWLAGVSVGLVAAVAGIFGCLMLWKTRRLWRQRELALELTARGLAWPAAFERVIPWSEVTEAVHRRAFGFNRGGGMAGVHVRVRDFERFKPKWTRKIWGLDLTQVAIERLPLPRMLDVDPKTLFQAIQAHRAHFGRGGRAAGS